jgi:hypothetical protein
LNQTSSFAPEGACCDSPDDTNPFDDDFKYLGSQTLDDEQRLAVQRILATPGGNVAQPFVLTGPAGTGSLVRLAMRKKLASLQRLLISDNTNRQDSNINRSTATSP